MIFFAHTFIRALIAGVLALLVFIGVDSSPFSITRESAISDPEVATSTLATSTIKATPSEPSEKKPIVITPKNPAIEIPLTSRPLPPIIQEIVPLNSLTKINEEVRAAVVNILCATASGGTLKPITGSGVIIDTRGVILTNAHIAQYFLLKDYPFKNNVDCTIRMGSPAMPLYKASLLFVSPAWIEANHKNITLENPLGTGEHDFALLLIDDTTNPNNTLPSSFPAISSNLIELDEDVVLKDAYVVAGYPAGFLGGISVIRDLYISSTVSSVKKVYTYKEDSIDLLSLGGSVLAQKGASGGAVVRQNDKKLVGIIVTTTDQKTTEERDLRAITTTHISRSLEASTNLTLNKYLEGDLKQKVTQFQNRFDQLKAILVSDLNRTVPEIIIKISN